MAHYSFTAFEWHLCEGDSEWEQTITWQDHHWHVVDFKPSGDGTGSEYVKKLDADTSITKFSTLNGCVNQEHIFLLTLFIHAKS